MNKFRFDGSFVINLNGLPYHVTTNDKLYNQVLLDFTTNPTNYEPEGTDTKKYKNGQWVDITNTPEYIAEQAQKERERIDNLTVTKRVFALALQSLGITYTQLKEIIATNETAQLEWDLCVELQRKNPLLDSMCSALGLTSEAIDNIFVQANEVV